MTKEKYSLSLAPETVAILLGIADAYGIPQDIELSDEEQLEIAIDLLVQSYDATMDNAMKPVEEVPMDAAELRLAIANTLEADISMEGEIHTPQQNLFSSTTKTD